MADTITLAEADIATLAGNALTAHRASAQQADALARGIAAADDVRLGIPGALKRVFDQSSDIVFVFNDEHLVP